MPIKEIEPIFSQGGYSIWKTESEGQSDPKRSEEFKKPFVVKNCFGTEVGSFDSKKKAQNFVYRKTSQKEYSGEFLKNTYNLVAIFSFFSVAASIIIGYLIAFKYTSQYGELWLLPRILNGDSIKLFSFSFLVIGIVFLTPLILGYLSEFLTGTEKISSNNENRFGITFLLSSVYANIYLFTFLILYKITILFLVLAFILILALRHNTADSANRKIIKLFIFQMFSFFSIVLLYPFVKSAFNEKLNLNHQWILVFFLYLVFVTIINYLGFRIASAIIHAEKIYDIFTYLIIIPVFLNAVFWAPFFNFSRLTFSLTGIGAHEYSIKLLDKTPFDPEIKAILKELKDNPGQKKNFCVFIQTKKALYIVDPANKKKGGFCSDPSFDDHLGTLVRVPIKYLASITPE